MELAKRTFLIALIPLFISVIWLGIVPHEAPRVFLNFDRRLDPSVFCRVSPTAIVNLGYVTEVDTLAGGYGGVLLKNGVRLEVSRRLRLAGKVGGRITHPDPLGSQGSPL